MTHAAFLPDVPKNLDGLPDNTRRWSIIAVAIATTMATLDIAIANTALPAIAGDLHASPATSVWIVNAYQLAMVATLLPFAALGEILGYRHVYIGGLILFTLASLACALSPSLPALVCARVLQGLGASAIMSVNTALVRFVYPARLLGRGLGLNALIVAVSFAIGPTIASTILSISTWPSLFAINVPLGLAALVLAYKTLPETPRSSYHFDAWMALFNVGTFGLLILGLNNAARHANATTIALELMAALIFGFLLLRRQAGHPAPMLPIDLLRRPMFALSTLTSIGSFAAQGVAFVSLPFYFETVLGLSQVETGFLMTPWPVVVAIMGPIAGRLSDRYSAGALGSLGLAILCLGMVLLAFLPARSSSVEIGWRMIICGIGFGFFQAPNLKAMMASVPAARSAAASGMVATARLLGQTFGAVSVALCFTVASTHHGATLALALGAIFAGVACIASSSRLFTKCRVEKTDFKDPLFPVLGSSETGGRD